MPKSDYCACDVDPENEEAIKEHHRTCGKKPPSVARPVDHAEKAASDSSVLRCHVCSISDLELKTIGSTGLVALGEGGDAPYGCPAHSDCPFEPSNYWGEILDGERVVVTRDSRTGHIIRPNQRVEVRDSYGQTTEDGN